MKALIYTGVGQMDWCETLDPVAAAGESIVRIRHSGICGSDMHAFLGHDDRRPAPLILGHEASGEVIDGPGRGQRVAINPLVACGTCSDCRARRNNLCADRQIISLPPRQGAFAELVAIPHQNLVAVPDHVDLASAALTEPLACGWHAVRLGLNAADNAPNNLRCAVLGGGAIGVGAALALTAFGVADITLAEPNPIRRRTLDRQPEFATTDGSALPGSAYDLVIDAVGYAATRATASAAVRPGGIILHIGLGEAGGGLDVRRMTLQEITFIGTYTYTAQDFRDTAQAIFDGRLGALDWTETRPLSHGQAAFEDIRAGRTAAPKIMLEP
jgi:L-iditol 2-dehydrogenase